MICLRFAPFSLLLIGSFVSAQTVIGKPPTGDCDRCGKIESIRPVTAKDLWTPLGSVSTTPQGDGTAATPSGVTMYQIGKGFSKQGTVVIGAAGGAAYRARPSELNAKRWEIVVRMEDGTVRIQVSDSGTGFRPQVVRPDDDDTSGRGLLLLDALSDRWGVRRNDERTEVWFELRAAQAQEERASAFG